MKRNPRLKRHARALRINATPAEEIVWQMLRSRRMQGYKFRRQHPLGPYIADFCCIDAKLVIELDGESHVGQRPRDERRDAWMRRHDYEVIRCWNMDVYENLEGLAERIWKLARERTPPEFRPEVKRRRRTSGEAKLSPRRGEGGSIADGDRHG